jgi:tetratricopeptide (TPR) repeat protein
MENSPRERTHRDMKQKARPSAPRLLVRGLLALWWTFVVAAALSGAQTLGNRTGPAFLSYAPQFLAFVRRQPWQIQLLADIGAAYVLALMAGITVLAYRAKREQGRVQEAAASAQRAAEMEVGVGRALDAKVVPHLEVIAQRQEMLAAAVVKPVVPALAPVSAPAPGAPLRVFIGSTSVDLEPYRARIAELVRNGFGQHSVTMEAFPLRPTGDTHAPTPDATSVSLEELASSQVYVLLVAWRYGHVPPGQQLSVTHQEYLAAINRPMPCFVFLADPSTDGAQHDSPQFPAAKRDPEHRPDLNTFRAELETHQIKYFTSLDDLVDKVTAAFNRYLIVEDRRQQAQARRVPFKLPQRVAGFVGRDKQLADLCNDVRQGRNVGLAAAVQGMAGVGKSALAFEALNILAGEKDTFPGGITWLRADGRVGLDGLTTLYDELLAEWDAALPAEEIARITDPDDAAKLRERTLRDRLRPPAGEPPPAALVLLDNVEPGLPLARALAVLAPLGLTVLLTARHEPSIPQLTLLRLDVLEPAPALALFAERYREKGGVWDEARDTPEAAKVVELLGRLPLAIELAAARAARGYTSVAALAAELGEANRLGKLRDPLDHNRSVRYAFEKTVGSKDPPGALTPSQRARFVALGLPAGPDWPRPLIEEFLNGVRLEDEESSGTDDLDTLIAYSLVAITIASGGVSGETSADVATTASVSTRSAPRVRLHPLLREYAQDLWKEQSEQNRHADIAALLAAIGTFVEQHDNDFPTLATEEELIVAAAHHAAQSTEQQLVIALVRILIDYIVTGGHWRTGLDLLNVQLTARQAVGDRRGEGTTLSNLGLLADNLGRREEAQQYYTQALAILREVGDRRGEGATLNNLGSLANSLGRQEEARAYFEQALAIRREVGDREGEGTTLHNMGALAESLGHSQEARAYYEQALAIYSAIGAEADVQDEVEALRRLDADE